MRFSIDPTLSASFIYSSFSSFSTSSTISSTSLLSSFSTFLLHLLFFLLFIRFVFLFFSSYIPFENFWRAVSFSSLPSCFSYLPYQVCVLLFLLSFLSVTPLSVLTPVLVFWHTQWLNTLIERCIVSIHSLRPSIDIVSTKAASTLPRLQRFTSSIGGRRLYVDTPFQDFLCPFKR